MDNSLRSMTRVRSVLATVCLLLAHSGFAQQQEIPATEAADTYATPLPEYMRAKDGTVDPEAIPWSASMWAFFNLVASLEKETPPQGKQLVLQSAVGLDERSADTVVKYIPWAMKDDENYMRELMAKHCRKLRHTRLRPQEIARKLAAADQAAIERREVYFTQLYSMLDETARNLLTNWIDGNVRSGMQIVEVDYESMIAEVGVDSATILSSLCTESGVERGPS